MISVGKIRDIFDGEGITESNKSKSSVHGMEQTIEIAERDFTGLCFVNLVDFDALWGHRRNVKGYAEELERFDVKRGELLKVLRKMIFLSLRQIMEMIQLIQEQTIQENTHHLSHIQKSMKEKWKARRSRYICSDRSYDRR